MKSKLVIGHLYGDLMNIYGDEGNIIALRKRAEWRGIEVEVRQISLGDKIKPGEIDLYFFGGGQDQAQGIVAKDLASKAEILRADIEDGIPFLAICGGYQLLGAYYQPAEGPRLEGVGIFQAHTKASTQRMIGNIVIKTDEGELVGFENHSGKTYLDKGAQPLGRVISGFGNNGEDKTEGCIYKNAIGCYMHGSLLPKNPDLADWLLEKALKMELKPLDDSLEKKAHQAAI